MSVKLMFDFLIAFNLLCSPFVDNCASKTVREVLPFAIDFFSAMSETMVQTLNDEQGKQVKNLSISSSMHLAQLQKRIVVTKKSRTEYLKYYNGVLYAKLRGRDEDQSRRTVKTFKEDQPCKV